MKKKILFVISILILSPLAAFGVRTIHVYYGNTNSLSVKSDSIAVPGEELRINIKLSCDSFCSVGFIHIPLSSNNTYVSSRTGGVILDPLITWDDVSFRPPDLNQPISGWTSQSLLGFADLDTTPQIYLHPSE